MSEQRVPSEGFGSTRSREARERSEMRRERFHRLVTEAIDSLPQEFQERLENVEVVVEDWPSAAQLASTGIRSKLGLLGLYEGVPHTRRGHSYGMVLPDKITVFRKPIEARCHSWKEVEEEIVRVVRHEIAHHFGIDERTLRTIEERQREKDAG